MYPSYYLLPSSSQPPPFRPVPQPVDFLHIACPTVEGVLARNPYARVCDFLDCFIVPPAQSGSGYWAAPSWKPTDLPPPLDARESQAAHEGPLAVFYDNNLAKSMSRSGRAALHCESDPAILWNALALLHPHTRYELDLAVGSVNLNLLGATTVDAKLGRTADAMRRLTHALTGDYGFIELTPSPLARSKESLTHCEIRTKGIVRGVIEERTKGVLDALVEEMKRLTEGGKRAILLSDLEGSSQAGAQSLLGKFLKETSEISGIATILWTDGTYYVPAMRITLDQPPPAVPLPSLSSRLPSPQTAPPPQSLSRPYFLVIGGKTPLDASYNLSLDKHLPPASAVPHYTYRAKPSNTSFVYSLLASTARLEDLYLAAVANLRQNPNLRVVLGELGLSPMTTGPLATAAGSTPSWSGGGLGGPSFGGGPGAGGFGGSPFGSGPSGTSDGCGGGSFPSASQSFGGGAGEYIAASGVHPQASSAAVGGSDQPVTSLSQASNAGVVEETSKSAAAQEEYASPWTKDYVPLRLQDIAELDAIPIARSYNSDDVERFGLLHRLHPRDENTTPLLSPLLSTTPTASSSDTSRTLATANASTSPRLLVFRDEPLAGGGTSSVHELEHDPDVLMKISVGVEEAEAVEHEGRLYQRFGKELTGILPEFYGMFSGRPLRTDSIILLLARHGRPIRVWGDLTKDQRKRLYQSFLRLHEVGIMHNDLSANNILVDYATDEVRIIDLNYATEHVCPGPKICPELKELSWLVYKNP